MFAVQRENLLPSFLNSLKSVCVRILFYEDGLLKFELIPVCYIATCNQVIYEIKKILNRTKMARGSEKNGDRFYTDKVRLHS